ncbi:MAG: DUF1553 domain-containing protein, partial [Gemmataceae bacterium]
AEMLRDTLLSTSGDLKSTASGGPSVRSIDSPRRTLYLTTIRSDRTGFRPLFDGADSTAIVDRRTRSTVAPQALFLMNDPFVIDQARKLAQRATKETAEPARQLNIVTELLLCRAPTEAERKLAMAFLRERSLADWCHLLIQSNEFIWID